MKKLFNVNDIFYTGWHELNADQAAAILIYKNQIDRLTQFRDFEKAGKFRLKLATAIAKKPGMVRVLSGEQIWDILEDVKFMDKPFYFFHITYIRTREGTLFRPDEYLSTFTFYQYIKAEAEFSKYLVLNYRNSPDQIHAIRRFIAIIYQPIVGRFNEDSIEKYAAALPKRLTLDLRFLIIKTYANCRDYIMKERCRHLFKIEAEQGIKKEPVYTGKMWQDLLFDLSETPAFTGLEKARNARLYEALDYLEKKSAESPKINR